MAADDEADPALRADSPALPCAQKTSWFRAWGFRVYGLGYELRLGVYGFKAFCRAFWDSVLLVLDFGAFRLQSLERFTAIRFYGSGFSGFGAFRVEFWGSTVSKEGQMPDRTDGVENAVRKKNNLSRILK